MLSPPDPAAGIVFEPVEITGLWSLQGNRKTRLADLVSALFTTTAQFGKPLRSEKLRLLPLWPQQAYLLSAKVTLPAAARKFEPLLTDISHGYYQFRLGGEQAFDFVSNYVSVDIAALRDAAACLRCRLGQYTVILWWDDHQHIHLLLERSYAQSFTEHIDALISRWRPRTL
jgi:sarcosine oxidase gamma subunit